MIQANLLRSKNLLTPRTSAVSLLPATATSAVATPSHRFSHTQPLRLCPTPLQHQPLSVLHPCQQYRQQQQQQRPLLPCVRAASSSSSSSGEPGRPAGLPSWLGWFDRLPARVQLFVMGGLLFLAMVVMPFLQPTFLYSNDSSSSGQAGTQITDVRPAAPSKFQLPRYVPVASELLDFLHSNAMPKTLPDGRSESPGVLRIYMASMIILGCFYVCSAVVSLILNGVAGVLRAAGVLKSLPPAKPEEQ